MSRASSSEKSDMDDSESEERLLVEWPFPLAVPPPVPFVVELLPPPALSPPDWSLLASASRSASSVAYLRTYSKQISKDY